MPLTLRCEKPFILTISVADGVIKKAQPFALRKIACDILNNTPRVKTTQLKEVSIKRFVDRRICKLILISRFFDRNVVDIPEIGLSSQQLTMTSVVTIDLGSIEVHVDIVNIDLRKRTISVLGCEVDKSVVIEA